MAEEGGMFRRNQTMGNVPCCKCGISMKPNAANMCVKCLRSEVDITEGLLKKVTILYCKECKTYLQPPKTRIKAELDSSRLLTFCLKRLNLEKAKVTLVEAEFKRTESHSKRIKVELRIRKELDLYGVVLEQDYVVYYIVHYQMCENCTKVQSNPDQWVASVQLRQHISHRRTFLFLEQLIVKHGAAGQAVRIKQMDQGIDFFFANRSHAVKFVDFIGKFAPIKSRSDKELVSHDSKNNTYNYKHTFSVDISPICREDLVCLPPKVVRSLGMIGPLVLCTKVSSGITLMDPNTLRHCFLDGDQYWRSPFKCLLSRRLVEYIVLDIDNVSDEVIVAGSRYALADAQVARVSDFGKNDTIFYIRTHLGHLLNPGDYALGYDLYGANTSDTELEKHKGLVLPEVILIKKSYEEKRQGKGKKSRSWKLKKLNMEVDESSNKGRLDQDIDGEEFLRDLEENSELRFNLPCYLTKEYGASETASVTDDCDEVPVEELLADLGLSGDEE